MSPHTTFTRIPLQVGSELRIRNNGEVSVDNPTIEGAPALDAARCGAGLPLRPADQRARDPAGGTGGAARRAEAALSAPQRKRDGHRAGILHGLARRRQPPACRIHAPGDDGVRLLVRGAEEPLRGIEADESRCAALARHPTGRAQHSGCTVHRKDGNAVVPAVGAIDKAAATADGDLRPGAFAGEIGGQGRQDLRRIELAGARDSSDRR